MADEGDAGGWQEPQESRPAASTAGEEVARSGGDPDYLLPIANVGRIMKGGVPVGAKISKDAKECVQECVSEFISFITMEANEKCLQEKRKTISGDDLIWAMKNLGFDNYVEPLSLYLNRYKQLAASDETTLNEGRMRQQREDGASTDEAAGSSIDRAAGSARTAAPHPPVEGHTGMPSGLAHVAYATHIVGATAYVPSPQEQSHADSARQRAVPLLQVADASVPRAAHAEMNGASPAATGP
ncbi:hypothetical protein KFE25_011881 [Diacronema lutheri]|uniref:Transcription factor CBF/NF-Y/archaeal histone domain-containing protein n=1 Tax=Diacronema lutheri TaxID=2081491 RepID=A0A8J5XKG2_DIALT|nr:hypothetical protein KFE25_011881 [Diacronema lutheri]